MNTDAARKYRTCPPVGSRGHEVLARRKHCRMMM